MPLSSWVFTDELSVIMYRAIDNMQSHGKCDPDERTLPQDETGGSVYLRLLTQPLGHQRSPRNAAFRQGGIDCRYWLRRPGPNTEIASPGLVSPAAIKAAARTGDDLRDIGVLAVISTDRLNAGWTAAPRARVLVQKAYSHVERLLASLPRHCLSISIIDGHPATLFWLGAVEGHRTVPRGVEYFRQTGTIASLCCDFRIAAGALWRPRKS